MRIIGLHLVLFGSTGGEYNICTFGPKVYVFATEWWQLRCGILMRSLPNDPRTDIHDLRGHLWHEMNFFCVRPTQMADNTPNGEGQCLSRVDD